RSLVRAPPRSHRHPRRPRSPPHGRGAAPRRRLRGRSARVAPRNGRVAGGGPVALTLPFLDQPHHVLKGPTDVGTEQRWLVQLPDGRRALVAQLAPDLARDESIRRRYV